MRHRHGSKRRRRSLLRRVVPPTIALLLSAFAVALYLFLFTPVPDPPAPVIAGGEMEAPVERTRMLAPVRLPADDGPHATATEWWYYSGHLFGEQGEHFSFHATVFLRDAMVRHTVFHGSLTDHTRGDRYKDQFRTGGVPSPGNAAGFDFRHRGWQISGFGPNHTVTMQGEGYALELELVDAYPPVLHRAAGSATPGLLDFGDAGITYYYSRPRMQARGTVSTRGQPPIEVTGEIWFDHQWGDFEPTHTGWNWFALQLDDGSNLMVYELFDRQGGPLLLAGSRSFGGALRPLSAADVQVRPLGIWRSPDTGVSYPASWEIELPEGTLFVEPLLLDSEFDGRETIFKLYWEGAVRVSGVQEGIGFVELSGYESILSGRRFE